MDHGDRYRINAETLLRAYATGVFPMAESKDSDDLFWVDPEQRGIFPLNGLHISRSLYKLLKQQKFEIRVNSDFEATMLGCAQITENRDDTWINSEILRLYTELHHLGCAHSVECWQGGKLVGGLYGVSLGGAFFGESMFSHVNNASKVALAHLIARLRLSGYILLDTQFVTEHLISLGAIEIPRRSYHALLDQALHLVDVSFYSDPTESELLSEFSEMFLQSKTQRS